MTILTKVADKMNGKADKLAEFIRSMSAGERVSLADSIEAAAANMPARELKELVATLNQVVAANAEANSAKSKRLARMSAAKADPLMQPAITLAAAELRRLGEDINAFAETGNVAKLDAAMKAAQWDSGRRIKMKTMAYQLGLIDP
jgi:hypothetical protein